MARIGALHCVRKEEKRNIVLVDWNYKDNFFIVSAPVWEKLDNGGIGSRGVGEKIGGEVGLDAFTHVE